MATLLSSRLASGAQTRPQRHPLAHVPGEDGWPIVGNTFAALRDPVGHAEAMYRKYGPVYRDSLFGVRSVALLGPDANELVLFDRDRNFSSSDGWGHLLDRLFPRGLMLMDFDEHRLHRKALGVAFKPAPMKAYLGALNDGISRHRGMASGRRGTRRHRRPPLLPRDQAADPRFGRHLLPWHRAWSAG
jgi:cytochrome P450